MSVVHGGCCAVRFSHASLRGGEEEIVGADADRGGRARCRRYRSDRRRINERGHTHRRGDGISSAARDRGRAWRVHEREQPRRRSRDEARSSRTSVTRVARRVPARRSRSRSRCETTTPLLWPATGEHAVKLSYHLYDATGRVVAWDGLRSSLPSDLPAGGGDVVPMTVTVAGAHGHVHGEAGPRARRRRLVLIARRGDRFVPAARHDRSRRGLRARARHPR